MPRARKDPGRIIVSYIGIDGACAAAMALRRWPEAGLQITSARRSWAALRHLAERAAAPTEIHVCGVGIWCEPEELAQVTAAEGFAHCRIVWHCGRGYLDGDRERIAALATPRFRAGRSNTEALAAELQLDAGDPAVARLLALARRDPNLDETAPTEDLDATDGRWLDLIHAAMAANLRYDDYDAYDAVIRRLARFDWHEEDSTRIRAWRLWDEKHLLTGYSPAIRKVKELCGRLGPVDLPVLIEGESGTGKEHAAHLIRGAGDRLDGPFLAVNCAVFAGDAARVSAELFGHVKGAFTGAVADRPGAFRKADGGILFLDELGLLPLEAQGPLLRVIEDGRVTPLGADEPRATVDVRLIAASSRDLVAMALDGRLLPDLYYRLAAMRIQMPPLRERPEDIERIVKHTLSELAAKGITRPRITRQGFDALREYHWPGNVRQLINFVRRMVYLELPLREALEDERRTAPDPRATPTAHPLWPDHADRIRDLEHVRRTYARRACELLDGNRTRTCKALGISPNTLGKLLTEQ